MKTLILVTFFSLYGLFTAYRTAATIGDTIDEKFYKELGKEYLEKRPSNSSEVARNHPMFSIWMGAVIPYLGKTYFQKAHLQKSYLANQSDLFYYRIYHFLCYFLVGIVLVTILWKEVHPASALIFSSLYNTDPTLKAMASLHVNDADVSIYMGLSTLLVWSLWRKKIAVPSSLSPDRMIKGLLAAFTIGLAINSKITALLMLPFYLLTFIFLDPIFFKKKNGVTKFLDLIILLVVGLSTIYICYFSILREALTIFIETIQNQLAHNHNGSISFMFGKFAHHGFWYFFIVLYFLKTPLLHIAITAIGIKNIISNFQAKKHTPEIILFYLPALLMAIFLSKGQIHIGYRYFLPVSILIMLGTSIVFRNFLKRFSSNKFLIRNLSIGSSILGFIVIFNLLVDYWAFTHGEYIAYFNLLTPAPTRNFCDSNNHWFQTPPPSPGFNYHRFTNLNLISFLKNDTGVYSFNTSSGLIQESSKGASNKYWMVSGASDLCGINVYGAPLDIYLRGLSPIRVEGAFEFFSMTPLELFLVLSKYKSDPLEVRLADGAHIKIFPLEVTAEIKKYCPHISNPIIHLINKNFFSLASNLEFTKKQGNKTINGQVLFKLAEENNTFLNTKKDSLVEKKVERKYLIFARNINDHFLYINNQALITSQIEGLSWNTVKALPDIPLNFKIENISPSTFSEIKDNIEVFWLECS